MVKRLSSLLLIAGLTAALAENTWISAGIPKVVKVRTNTTTAYFKTHEGGSRKWIFEHTTPQGKSLMAMLLMAQSQGTPVTLYEGNCSSTYNECEVLEFVLGNEVF